MARDDETKFLSDVLAHTMEIVRDDGVHRHLTFRKPSQSWHYWFELVTWPGALCIRGDMGTFVFSRLPDMFEFFRQPTTNGSLYINASYWAEKLIASECHGRHGGGVMRFDPDIFADAVKRQYVEHARLHMRGMPNERRELREALEDEVLSCADEGEDAAIRAACNFESNGFALQDFWEVNCREYTAQFIWSLYAIAWGIQRYDKQKIPAKSEAA